MKKNYYFYLLFSIIVLSNSLHSNAQIIITIAGDSLIGSGGDGGPATLASLDFPFFVKVDNHGNVFISEMTVSTIRKVNTSGIITTYAGNGTFGFSGDDGQATAAQLYSCGEIAVDTLGNVYIADNGNHRVRKVNAIGIISTIAGTGTPGYSGDNGPATAAEFNSPYGIAVDINGNIYVSDGGNYHIRKINPSGIISTIAGDGVTGYSGDGFAATDAQIAAGGIATDNIGNVYFVDQHLNHVRKVDTSGIITTVAGDGTAGFGGDGSPATSSQLNNPHGVAIDKTGNIYIADDGNSRVRKVNPSGIISTIAGNGIDAFCCDNGPATNAELFNPLDVSFDNKGNVYIADYEESRIRKVTIPDIAISSSYSDTICAGTQVIFTASVNNDAGTPQYQWQVNNINVGTDTSAYVTDTLHNGDVVTCVLSYIFGDTVTTTSNTYTIYINPHPPCPSAVVAIPAPSEGLTIFPNPNDGALTLSVTTPTNEQATITITNILGEKIKQFTTTTNVATQVKMEMPEGVYFISATTASGRWNEKVVVSNSR